MFWKKWQQNDIMSKIIKVLRRDFSCYDLICFSRAAKDGVTDILKECTRKDCNARDDENGMTPVLWASFEGQLEALRLLVGKG